MHFLSIALSDLIAITNSNGDYSSHWNISLWIFILAKVFPPRNNSTFQFFIASVIMIMRVFLTSFNCCFFTVVQQRASLFRSPWLFELFYPVYFIFLIISIISQTSSSLICFFRPLQTVPSAPIKFLSPSPSFSIAFSAPWLDPNFYLSYPFLLFSF